MGPYPLNVGARTYLTGSCPCADLHSAARDDQSPDPTDERPKFLLSFGRIALPTKALLGCHVWARDYFCRRSDNVTDEVIKAYIAQQAPDSDDVFPIEGEASPSKETPLGDPS
jgi:hypothetical protein